jgi:hypothetical protein
MRFFTVRAKDALPGERRIAQLRGLLTASMRNK